MPTDEQTNEIKKAEEMEVTPKIGQAATVVTAGARETMETEQTDIKEMRKALETEKQYSSFTEMADEIYFYHSDLMPHYDIDRFDETLKFGSMTEVKKQLDDLDFVIRKTDDSASREQATYLREAIKINVAAQKLDKPEDMSFLDKRYFNGGITGGIGARKLTEQELRRLTDASLLASKEAGMFHGTPQDEASFRQHMYEKYLQMNESGLSRSLRLSLNTLEDEHGRRETVQKLLLAKMDKQKNYSDQLVDERKKLEAADERAAASEVDENYSPEDTVPAEMRKAEPQPQAATADSQQKMALQTEPVQKEKKQESEKADHYPTAEEVKAYAKSIGYHSFDAALFMERQKNRGWNTTSGEKITNWKRNVQQWQRRSYHLSKELKAGKTPQQIEEVKEKLEETRMKDLAVAIDSWKSGVEGIDFSNFAPTKQETREYFEKQGLQINADDFYKVQAANGWLLNSGEPILSWKTLALEQNKTYLDNLKKFQSPKMQGNTHSDSDQSNDEESTDMENSSMGLSM